jgi:plastocyanin
MMYTAYGLPKETNRSTGNYKQSVPTVRFKQTSSSSRLEAHSPEPAFSENTSKEGAAMNLNRIFLVSFCLLILTTIASGATHEVVVGPNNDDVFEPPNITINVGDTVHWTWADNGHTVTSTTGNNCVQSGLFDSGLLNTGDEFSFAFNTVGTVNYMCEPHCDEGMKGVVVVADFTISCSPNQVTVNQGSSGTSTCTVTSVNTFNSPVTLSTTGLPAGVTASFNPNPATPPPNSTIDSTLTLDVGGTVNPGSYPFTVTATNDDLVHTFNMTLIVQVPTADFTLACVPPSLTISPGASDTSTCSVTSLNDYTNTVSLSCILLPTDITCSFNPTQVTPPANGTASSTLTVSVGANASAGSYNFDVQGTDGSLTHTTPFVVNVNPLYIEDFEDGVADGFTFLKGTWTVANGELSGTHDRKANALAPFVMAADHTVEADISTDGGAGSRTSLLAWQADKKNLVEVLAKEAEDRWVLKFRINGSVVAKAKAIQTILPNTNYRVKLEHDGTAYHLSIDGTEIIVLNAGAPPSGVPGFRVKATTSAFGEIVVY